MWHPARRVMRSSLAKLDSDGQLPTVFDCSSARLNGGCDENGDCGVWSRSQQVAGRGTSTRAERSGHKDLEYSGRHSDVRLGVPAPEYLQFVYRVLQVPSATCSMASPVQGRDPKNYQASFNRLYLPRIACLRNLPEVGVARQTGRILELCVVPGIEELRPELQADGLAELRALSQRLIPVVQAKSSQDTRAGVPEVSGCWRGETRDVEPVQPVFAQVVILRPSHCRFARK